MIRKVVVLPQLLAPGSANSSPRLTENDTPTEGVPTA